MPTLFEIGAEICGLDNLLEDLGGDITDREAEVDAWFDRLDGQRDQKLDTYAGLITELEARASVREQEAMRLQHRARMDADKASWLKRRLQVFFELTNLKTVETPRYRITLATNGGKQPVVVSVEPELLPDLYRKVRTEVKPDLDAIRTHLEAIGPLQSPDGVVLAQFGERGRSIRIR